MDPQATLNRLVRLARLDTSVFDEVRDDPAETIPSLVVAAVSALLAGLGAMLWWQVVVDAEPDSLFLNTFILGSVFLFGMYLVAGLVVYVVMAQLYRTTADVQTLLRTLGYAAAPLSLSLLMFLPVIYPVFAIVPIALVLTMMFYAVQSATGADSVQVATASIIGFTVMVLVLGLITLASDLPDAPMGAGIFGILLD